MGSFKPLFLAIAFLVFMGFVIPYAIGFFVDVSDIQPNDQTDAIITFLENGFEMELFGLVDIDINPFFWLPTAIMDYITDSFLYLSLLPEFLFISSLVLIAFSLIYGVIALVRGI